MLFIYLIFIRFILTFDYNYIVIKVFNVIFEVAQAEQITAGIITLHAIAIILHEIEIES